MRTVAQALCTLLMLVGVLATSSGWMIVRSKRLHTLLLPAVLSNHGRLASSPRKGVGVEVRAAVGEDIRETGAAWWHNWYVTPDAVDVPGFVPTVGIPEYIGRPVATSGGWLLTFNEPNGPRTEGGSDVRPEEAAALWRELMAAYPSHDLLAPTVRTQAAEGYPDWREWLDRWWAGLSHEGQARVAGVSLNCYASTADCQAIVGAVRAWGRERGVDGPVVLKEFFDPDMVAWLEEQNLFYAWFLARVPDDVAPTSVWSRALFDDGGLTAWGNLYRGLPE